MRGAQVGALRQEVRRDAAVDGGDGEGFQAGRAADDAADGRAKQAGEGGLGLLPLVLQLVAAGIEAGAVLFRLAQVKLAGAARAHLGAGEFQRLCGVLPVGGVQRQLVVEVGDLQVGADDVADEGEAGGEQVFGAGFAFPLGVTLGEAQFAPEIGLVTDAEAGAVVLAGASALAEVAVRARANAAAVVGTTVGLTVFERDAAFLPGKSGGGKVLVVGKAARDELVKFGAAVVAPPFCVPVRGAVAALKHPRGGDGALCELLLQVVRGGTGAAGKQGSEEEGFGIHGCSL